MVKYETDTNLRYEVDLTKGTVTCFVDNCIDDFRNVFLKKSCSVKNGNKIADMLDYIITKHIDCGIEDTYSGVAVCDKEDKFNLDIGADLARSRALAKREMAYGNVIISVLNFLEEISEFIPEIRNVVGLYDKHNTNANAISISGKTLAEIRGLKMKENLLKIGDTMAVPHYCDVCDKYFLNYVDDIDFEKNEKDWEVRKMSCGEVFMEICGDCK